ncbi:MAG: DUF1460 domain-containing protein [Oligoflexales bacterium]|nr:DUF1460 domain-containing protein [Oligoflexales bacterium]
MVFFSERFLGLPYLESALGEGGVEDYDDDPLYRFDSFDCTTYVETIIAMSLASDFSDFKKKINLIRYKNGEISFTKRNHFMTSDWIPNNSKAGIIEDITKSIGRSKKAQAIIRKHSWYNKLHQSQLATFLALGIRLHPEKSSIPYISLNNIFPKNRPINHALINKIPNGAIINVVRPNWNLRKSIGTNLNVSHQGIAIWKQGVLYFRHASSKHGKVIDSHFAKTFKTYLTSPTIKGINVLAVK